MNQMGHMKDPAAGVPPQLLAHMHLISKHRYPVIANPSLEMIVGFLLEAPKIVRDVQPVQWQFLDCPPDGSLILAWQPLEYLGTNFASDGYVWADAEQSFTSEVQGYKLEFIMHRSGYKATGEALACHSRKRYRLTPSNNGVGLPTPDPALWLVHYTRATTRDHIAAASIPIQPQVQAQLQQRRVIQASGQLGRKEFMLHDRGNWPVISPLPSMTGRPGSGPMVLGAGHRRGGSMNTPLGQPTVEEEEDVSRGDALDLVTPREISRMRYEQHHEWMEEVLESPYNIYQIIPPDLGLGRKGELESLTQGFFEAPTSGANPTHNGVPARVGKMDAGKAAEFTKLAAKKVAEMQKDLEEMRAKHARRMQKLKHTSVLADAEKKLRTASNSGEAGDAEKSESASNTDDIVREVEAKWGRKIEKIQNVTMVQRGGVEDPAPRVQSSMSGRTMSCTSQVRPFGSGSFGQGTPGVEPRQSPIQQQQPFPPQQPTQQVATPQAHSEPQLESRPEPEPEHMPQEVQLLTSATTMLLEQEEIPSIASEAQPQPDPASTITYAAPTSQPESRASAKVAEDMDMADDINMDSLSDAGPDADAQPETEPEPQDWVMVDENAAQTPEQGQEAMATAIQSANVPPTETAPALPAAPPTAAAVPPPPSPPQTKPASPSPPESSMGLDSNDMGLGDVDDFDNVANMDTAGEALAQYGDEGDDLDLEDMDESAFGDAFHPPDE